MTAPTPAVERAAEYLIAEADGACLITDDVRHGLDLALDVVEITEALAREQWNTLPLVVSGEMFQWDDERLSTPFPLDSERNHFRARCRPFAEAVRRTILGES